MKKLLFVSIILLYTSATYSQTSEQCVNCKSNILEGKYSSAIGIENIVGGHFGFAGGTACNVNGEYAFAFGKNNIAGKRASFAVGENSEANGMYSIAMGFGCKALGNMGVALGFFAEANSSASLALGKSVKTSATSSFVIGRGYDEQQLENNIGYSLMIGINSTKPTFFVSKSVGGMNATGKIGIGNITTPEAKLHIKADNNEDASILLQPTGANYYAKLLFGENGNQIYAKSNDDLKFSTGSGKDFVFENGNVRLETGFDLRSDAVITSQIKPPDAAGLHLTGQNGNGIFVEDGGNVDFGTLDASSDISVFGNAEIHETLAVQGNCDFGSNVIVGGNIGIGTSPNVELDVIGSINFTGNLLHNNQPFETSKWEENGNDIYYDQGNVGIGTSSPAAQLELADIFDPGGMNLKIGNDVYLSDIDEGKTLGILGCSDNTVGAIRLGLEGPKLYGTNGNLGIGTVSPDALLTVAGIIHAQEVMISLDAGDGADFVFNDNYELPDLSDVEEYIKTNNHLPDIPSAEEMQENGLELGDMQIKLLQKVEELTLYIIEQQNRD